MLAGKCNILAATFTSPNENKDLLLEIKGEEWLFQAVSNLYHIAQMSGAPDDSIPLPFSQWICLSSTLKYLMDRNNPSREVVLNFGFTST